MRRIYLPLPRLNTFMYENVPLFTVQDYLDISFPAITTPTVDVYKRQGKTRPDWNEMPEEEKEVRKPDVIV